MFFFLGGWLIRWNILVHTISDKMRMDHYWHYILWESGLTFDFPFLDIKQHWHRGKHGSVATDDKSKVGPWLPHFWPIPGEVKKLPANQTSKHRNGSSHHPEKAMARCHGGRGHHLLIFTWNSPCCWWKKLGIRTCHPFTTQPRTPKVTGRRVQWWKNTMATSRIYQLKPGRFQLRTLRHC